MVMQQFAKLCNRKVELVRFQYAPPVSHKHLGAMYRSPKPTSGVRVLGGVPIQEVSLLTISSTDKI